MRWLSSVTPSPSSTATTGTSGGGGRPAVGRRQKVSCAIDSEDVARVERCRGDSRLFGRNGHPRCGADVSAATGRVDDLDRAGRRAIPTCVRARRSGASMATRRIGRSGCLSTAGAREARLEQSRTATAGRLSKPDCQNARRTTPTCARRAGRSRSGASTPRRARPASAPGTTHRVDQREGHAPADARLLRPAEGETMSDFVSSRGKAFKVADEAGDGGPAFPAAQVGARRVAGDRRPCRVRHDASRLVRRAGAGGVRW